MAKRILLSVVLVVILAGSAFATVSSSTMMVSTYLSSITMSNANLSAVSVSQLSFGSTSYPGTYKYATATVAASVPILTLYKIFLNAGIHYGGGARHVAYGSSQVAYWLYKDALRLFQWGDSDLTNSYPAGSGVGAVGIGLTQYFPIYGKLNPPSLTSAAGTHTDVVTVTIVY